MGPPTPTPATATTTATPPADVRAAEAIYGGGPRPGNTSTVKKLKKDDT